jgi:hypothetical protein
MILKETLFYDVIRDVKEETVSIKENKKESYTPLPSDKNEDKKSAKGN